MNCFRTVQLLVIAASLAGFSALPSAESAPALQSSQCSSIHGDAASYSAGTYTLNPGDVINWHGGGGTTGGTYYLAGITDTSQFESGVLGSSGSFSFTVPGTPGQQYVYDVSSDQLNLSCTPIFAGSNSTIQQTASLLEGQTSQAAMNDMLDSVISGATSTSFSSFSSGPNGVTMMISPGQQGKVTPTADIPVPAYDPWRLFAAGRYTHVSGSDTGDQFNGLFGVSHRLGEAAAVGLFGGYEGFTYSDATAATFMGHGGTVGAFLAGAVDEHIKLDVRLYGSLLNYNITAGGASGTTSAQRLGTSITASYELLNGPLAITPFVRGSGLFEWDAAYTDSAATIHAANSYSVGMLSPGLRIAHRSILENGITFTPFAAAELDYAFGTGILVGFNDTQGLAGKVSAGMNWATPGDINFGIDGSYGGIGTAAQSQSVQLAISIPF